MNGLTKRERQTYALTILAEEACEGTAAVVAALIAHELVEHGTCWPSVPRLAECARLSPKQVRHRLRCLVSIGAIADTGERKGRTGQVVVWKVGPTAKRLARKPPDYENADRRPLSGRLRNPTRLVEAGPDEERLPPEWVRPRSEVEGAANA